MRVDQLCGDRRREVGFAGTPNFYMRTMYFFPLHQMKLNPSSCFAALFSYGARKGLQPATTRTNNSGCDFLYYQREDGCVAELQQRLVLFKARFQSMVAEVVERKDAQMTPKLSASSFRQPAYAN